MIAGECEIHEGKHICEDILLLEIVDDTDKLCEAGQIGNVIITDFYNKSFPFIRYKIGDRASLYADEKPCECGRTLKRLKQVEGRASEMIRYGNLVISPIIFPGFFKQLKNLESYQVLVYKDYMQINVILYDKDDKQTLKQIEDHLSERFDNKVKIKASSVSSLLQEKNGKVIVVKKMD